MPTIDINDTTIYYERSGGGPAVLFVHGMCGDAEVWADQARRLSDRHTCVRYDRRGHSRSHRGDAVVTDALHVDDVAALVETLGLAVPAGRIQRRRRHRGRRGPALRSSAARRGVQ